MPASLKKNLFLNVGYQLLVIVIPLILTPYLSRALGPESTGHYAYSYNLAYFFSIFGLLGVSNYGSRTIASCGEDIEKRSIVFWSIWYLQIITSVIVLVAYLFYVYIRHEGVLAYIQAITILTALLDISWFFYGIEKFQITVFRNLIIKIINIVLILLFVHEPGDVIIYSFIMVGCLCANNLILFPFLKNNVRIKYPSIGDMMVHLKPMLVLFFPVVAVSLYKIMDKVMIGSLASATQLGFYEYAEKIISIPGTIITAVGMVMLPRLSSIYGVGENKNANRMIISTMEILVSLIILLAGGIFAVSKDFAPLFFWK